MNERIRELAEQATLAVTKPDGHYIVQAWQAKFAELIVRECADIANQWQVSEHPGLLVKDVIKQHFGVEE